MNYLFNINKEYKIANLLLAAVLLIFFILPFNFSIIDSNHSIFSSYIKTPTCFVKEHTGKSCPACGLTRSIVALYHGEWRLSRQFHAWGFVIVIFLLFELLLRIVPVLFNKMLLPWIDIGHLIAIAILGRYILSI